MWELDLSSILHSWDTGMTGCEMQDLQLELTARWHIHVLRVPFQCPQTQVAHLIERIRVVWQPFIDFAEDNLVFVQHMRLCEEVIVLQASFHQR